jgi:hypothetical protein
LFSRNFRDYGMRDASNQDDPNFQERMDSDENSLGGKTGAVDEFELKRN